jgi:hypothetical protein
MDFQIHSLNQLLISIAETKNKLSFINYNDPLYDSYEDKLHTLEDVLMETYGDYLDNTLNLLYQQFSFQEDLSHPLSYIPSQFEIKEKDGNLHFNVLPEHCLKINSDKYPEEIIKVVLLPSPARFVVYLLRTHKELIWKVND